MSKQVTVKEDRLKSLISTQGIKDRFAEMLGKKAPAFLSSIISAVNGNKQLKDCDPMSVISAAAVAASLDLPVNPSLGHAYIVPYKDSAQFQVGWKGFVQLAMRSGQYKTIHATEVFEGQIKNHNPLTGEMEFNAEANSDKIIGYLCYFKLLNGFEKYTYMTTVQVDAHAKKYSQTYKRGFGVWKDNFDAMALKTVTKMALSKYGILSIQMEKALESDQAEVTDSGFRYVDGQEEEEAPKEKKQSRLAQALDLEPDVEAIPDVEVETQAKSDAKDLPI